MAMIYRVGERVDGLYDENTDEMWYPGRVQCVHLGDAETDGADSSTFQVLYDDGEVETHVRPEFLRQHVPGTICVGTRVLCRYDGGEDFYPGQVSDVQENGNYTIAYDDGEVEEDVPLDHIMEPTKREDEEEAINEEMEPSETADDVAPKQARQQDEEDAEMEEARDSLFNPVNDADSRANMPHENDDGERNLDEPVMNEPSEDAQSSRAEQSPYDEPTPTASQSEDHSVPIPAGVSTERAYIIESLQLLEKRLGDAASTKSVLSTLVKQMRAYPQVTADLVHEGDGERLIIDALKFHQSHAVIQCYGFVLLRRLCFLCVKSTHYLLRNGIVELVLQAMNSFAEDAILQASACGALAVFTRVNAGLNILIEYQVAQLVLSTLIYHKTYSVHTRQVHYYACEVLLELCELDDLQTLSLLCGEQEEDFTGDMSPISLLLFLLRQGLSLDDKKACCAVGSLLMCLAASGRRAAALILSLNGLAELSTVMARYPTELSIQKYSSAASKQIALSSVRQSPTKRIKDTAKEILREAESLENTPTDRPPTKRNAPRRSTTTGKRKGNPTAGYGAPAYPRGASYSSSTPYRNSQGLSNVSSPYGQPTRGLGGDTSSLGYPVRDFTASATAPQPQSSLIILDGSLGMDNGYGSTSKRKQLSKEGRQSELFDAYGIQGIPNSANGRPYGTKRAQLKAHLASAESAWATPQQYGRSATKPYSSRSEYLDHGPAYSQRDFMSSRQNRWEYDIDENPVYDPELRQPQGAKRKKKNPGARTAFQVKIENENQLRVSRETRSPYPSPQRLGAATKRAAKARQKRITGGAHSSLTGRSNNASSESLNDYATQLFQENARVGTGIPANSKLTPREKEEIRERERLSFAEKLHKMIDKAKSTLANGGTTSVAPVDDATRLQKSDTSAKPARKTREPEATRSEEKRPQSKKSRTVVGSTPKSPREAAETRPPKPISGVSKRQNDVGSQQTPSSHQAPVASRGKPNSSRPAVPPKITADPRAAVKQSKITATKTTSKQEADTSNAETVPAEIAPVSTPITGEPHKVEANATESARSITQPNEESAVPLKLASAGQVESDSLTSNYVAREEAVAVPSEATAGSETEPHTVEPGTEHEGSLSLNEEQPTQISGEEKMEAVSTPAEAEIVATFLDSPLTENEDATPATGTEIIVEAAIELPDPPVKIQQSALPPSEELSAALESVDNHPAAVSLIDDAMYGDAFSEFDDNGGDDEDATTEAGADSDDAQTSHTESSDPAINTPHESKSGEALYDDGYDEFDEDASPNSYETEAEDVPAPESVENQDVETSDTISTQPAEDIAEPASSTLKVEAENLVGESDESRSAAVDESGSAPPNEEGEGEDENVLHGSNGEKKSESAEATPLENECTIPEPEESQEPPTEMIDTGNLALPDPSDSDPVVSNIEGEQEEIKLPSVDTNLTVEPCGENASEEDHHDDPVITEADETGSGGIASEHAGDAADGGNMEDAARICEAQPSATGPASEPTATDSVAEDAEISGQPVGFEDEILPVNPQDEATAMVHPVTEDTPGDSIPGEGRATKVADTDGNADETLVTNGSAPSLEQEEESRTLSADNSNLSIQSAAYDEENFDEEECHQEAKPSEASDLNPADSTVEEGVNVANQEQEQGDETSGVTEIPAEAEAEKGVVNILEREADESNTLAANSSELSVESAAYEDEDFDDAAHDESQHENDLDTSDDKTCEQEPSEDEVTNNADLADLVAPVDNSLPALDSEEGERPMEVTVDAEALTEVPRSCESEDPDHSAPGDSPDETTAESLAPEVVDENSEQQQLVHDDTTATAESGTVAEPTLIAIENEVPGTAAQEEITKSDQEPAINEAEQYVDDVPVDTADEVAPESDSVPAAATEDLLDNSNLVAVTVERSVEPSTIIDSPESEAPEIAIPSEPTQEEGLESPGISDQPATYDDDDFDNGAEEEEVPPSAAALDSGIISEDRKDEDSKSEKLDARPSEDASIDDQVATDADKTHSPVVVVGGPPEFESEQPVESAQSPPGDATDSGVDPNKADGSISEVTPEPGLVAVDLVQDGGDYVETPTTNGEDNVGSATDGADSLIPSVAPPEPDLQAGDGQPGDQEDVSSPGDSLDVLAVTESAADTVAAEEMPDPEAQSIKPDAAGTDQAAATTDDDFEEASPESDPILTSVSDMAGSSVQSSVDEAHEENQYGDAGFNDVEIDAAALKDVTSGHGPIQNDPSASDEAAPVDATSGDDCLSDQVTPAEEGDVVVSDAIKVPAEVDNASTEEEATTLSTEMQGTGDAGIVANIGGEAAENSEQPQDDATAEADGNNGPAHESASEHTRNAAEVELKDDPLVSVPDASAYEEDFRPDTPPEAQEDAAVDVATTPLDDGVICNDDTAADDEIPAVELSANNELFAADQSDDVPPEVAGGVGTAPDLSSKEERYADGFDDDKTPPATESSDLGNAVESLAAEVKPTDNVDAVAVAVPEANVDNSVAESQQPHGDPNVDSAPDTNALQDGVEAKSDDCDGANSAEVEPTNTQTKTEADTFESEASEPEVAEHEPLVSEAIEPETAKMEVVEDEHVISEVSEPEAAKIENVKAEVVVEAEVPEAAESEFVEPEAVESEAVESGDSSPVPDVSLEGTTADSSIEDHAVPEATEENNSTESPETTIVVDPVVSEAGDVASVDDLMDSPVEANDQSSIEPRDDYIQPTEDAIHVPQEALASSEEGNNDPPQTEEPIEIASGDAPAVTDPATADGPEDPVPLNAASTEEANLPSSDTTSPVEESVDGADYNGDNVPHDSEGAADELKSAEEVVKHETAEVNNEHVNTTNFSSDAATSETAEPVVTPTGEAHPLVERNSSGQPDYAEAELPEGESAAAIENSEPTDEVVQEESPPILDLPEVSTEVPREEPEVQQDADVPETSEELAIDVEPPQSDEVAHEAAVDATPPAASEAPKTEDQYDDEESYNDFDDQENESATPAAAPGLEIPAPAATATEAPTTEDEYEEYENEDYVEDEKPVEAPRADPLPSSSPASAREEEIAEVADEPEEAEEGAYADEQDEYNNEYEEDEGPAAASRGSSPRTKKDQSSPRAEASADEYDEEDYAEDEIEDSSPPAAKPAPVAQPAAASDDEMEEDLGYDSGYADSDG